MNSRNRVIAAIEHKPVDRLPVDLGSTVVTGIHVTVVWRLRKALGLKDRPVRIVEPYGMLGEVDEELTEMLGIDTVAFWPPQTVFGFGNENWKPWTMPDGTEVLVPEKFNTDSEPGGRIYQYPCGDKTAAPSAVMPKDGFYFDSINRQQPIDDSHLNVQDNLEDYTLLTDEQLEYYAKESQRLYNTGKAVVGLVYGTNFGDPGYLTAPWRKETKGIRSTEEWYMGLLTRPAYVKELFAGQCEMALKNLELVHQAVSERITVICVCGNDLGTQNTPLVNPQIYDDLFKPVHRKINDWIHKNTRWKTFFHSCGAISTLLPGIVQAGFDILNPIQWKAAGMDKKTLKQKYGDKICFWGGGIDTQQTLPFGTPQEVYNETRQCIEILGKGGGYVFNIVHCIQPNTPTENILAMFKAVKDSQRNHSLLGICLSGLLLLWFCGCRAQTTPALQEPVQRQAVSETSSSKRAIESTEAWEVPEYVSSSGSTGVKISTAHYEIFTTVTDNEARSKTAGFMESAFWAYSNLIKQPIYFEKKLEIYFFQTRSQWEEFTRRWTGSQASIYLNIRSGGYYYNGACVVYDLQSPANLSILAHEAWHQFSDAVFRYRLPAWLDEGLAVNFEGFRQRDGVFEFDPAYNANRLAALERALSKGTLIRLSDLLTTDAGRILSKPDSQATKLSSYYAQLYALIRFLREYNNGQYLTNFHTMLEDAYFGQWQLDPQLAAQALQNENPSRQWNYQVSKFIFQTYITPNPSDLIPAYETFCRTISTNL